MKNLWIVLGTICVLAFYLSACDSGGKAPDNQMGKSSESAERTCPAQTGLALDPRPAVMRPSARRDSTL